MNNPSSHTSINLILASESPYKRSLLQKILSDFQSIAPQIDESPTRNETPYELAARLAGEKASAILQSGHSLTQNSWVLGCDQVAVLHHNNAQKYTLLNKPGSFERAKEQLTACSGKKVAFHTACSLQHADTGEIVQLNDTYNLYFRTLNEAQIIRYLERDLPYDCAGSIKSEALGVLLIKRFEGDDPNTLVGLPLIKLIRSLEQLGFDLFDS